MENELIIGLRLSVIGLSVTFLALGLVILVMVLLIRLFPDRGESGQEESGTDLMTSDDVHDRQLEEMAVALAVGICLLERNGALESRDPTLGKLLEQ